MKRDLEIAREIQSWLVPSEPPAIPGAEVAFWTRPQNSVAGDYYDAFYPTADAASGGKLLLVMADVAGKSVPAALLMATLAGQPAYPRFRGPSPHATCRAPESLRLRPQPRRPPLHHRRDWRIRSFHAPPGLCERRAQFTCRSPRQWRHRTPRIRRLAVRHSPRSHLRRRLRRSAAGDTLVLFTDGVVEAFNSAGEEFTDARWLQLIRDLPNLPAQAILQYLMQQVGQFVGATRQSDDITCLVLRCK